jgi:hypothetical protein
MHMRMSSESRKIWDEYTQKTGTNNPRPTHTLMPKINGLHPPPSAEYLKVTLKVNGEVVPQVCPHSDLPPLKRARTEN